jgi:hypothetical protein
MSKDCLIPILDDYLPTYERATALAEAYLENVNWLPRPIQREQIMEELLPMLYKHRGKVGAHKIDENHPHIDFWRMKVVKRMHFLGLAYALFACGSAADLTQAADTLEGKTFNYLARAAVNSTSVFDTGASMENVQALMLLASVAFFTCEAPSLESSWKMMSFAHLLGVSVSITRWFLS